MPSENDVFGGADAKPEANGGAPGGAGPLGDSGSDESGGAESPAAGSGGVKQGASGSTGASGSKGASGSTGTSGASGSTGASGSKGASGSTGSGGAGSSSAGSSGSTGFDAEAGLVAYFTFDDSSGAVATNAKDSTKNAKCVGTCTHPTGQLGNAFGLRNNVSPTDWLELPTGVFKGRSATTLSVWFRDLSTTRTAAPIFHFSQGANEAISFTPDDKNSSKAGGHLAGVHSGTSFVELWSATPVLNDKTWHQLAFSWNSTSIELYLDGKSAGSAPKPNVLPSDLGTTSPNYLGRLPDDTSLALFGEVDDLRIYDRVLSAAQVAQLYKVR